MEAYAYTLATYRVKAGKEDEFKECWHRLAQTFSSLPDAPYWGTLIRSRSEPRLFHSFGPWEKAEHVAAMRANEKARAAFAELGKFCEEMTPGDYEVVRHVRARPGANP